MSKITTSLREEMKRSAPDQVFEIVVEFVPRPYLSGTRAERIAELEGELWKHVSQLKPILDRAGGLIVQTAWILPMATVRIPNESIPLLESLDNVRQLDLPRELFVELS